MRAALDAAGLRCRSAHIGYDRLRDDLPGAFAEAKGLGAAWVVCPWIPHEKVFTRDDALKAAEVFNKFGDSRVEREGLRFAYHCHGYEFVPSPEGTLFETLAGATDPARVTFQVDVFHALSRRHGSGAADRAIQGPRHKPAPQGHEEGHAGQGGHGGRPRRRTCRWEAARSTCRVLEPR